MKTIEFLTQSEAYRSLFTLNRSLLGAAVVLATSSFLSPSSAYAAPIPLATTNVYKLCEVQAGGYDIDQGGSVPQPYAQATACNISVAGTVPYTNAASSASAEGYASAGFGPGIPQVGTTSAGAQAASIYGTGKAYFGADVWYSFEIQPTNTAPGTPPSLLPILFGARGAGYVQVDGVGAEGYGGGGARSRLIVDLYGSPLPTENEFGFDYYQSGPGNQGGSFNDTKSMNLYSNYTYTVGMSAACEAVAIFGSAGGSARCTAWGDPSIAFDQAAFDALMGVNTYNLNEYYNIAFSANVVPIPSAVWLFGSGLIGLIGLARRKKA